MQSNKSWYLFVNDWANAADFTGYILNAGQKPFKFPPPDGFQPINAANVRPETVIARPDQYVGVTTYTGDGNSGGRRINIGFRPDLIWLKSRGSGNHGLYDSVRGPDKRLQSDGTAAEGTVVFPGASNFGFDFGSETYYNASSTNYVAWTWKAGGNKNTFNVDDVGYATAAAAGLSGGERALTGCSVNTKAGFSIISWVNGTTTSPSSARVRHGLNQVPDLVIYKDRDSGTSQWAVKMETFSNPVRDELYLETTQAKTTAGVDLYFRDSDYIGHRETSIGSDGGKIIAYCWHNVPGLQKFGSFTGNATGNPFIELGFRPALLWIKNTSTSSTDWVVIDSERQPFNQSNLTKLYTNSTNAESTIGVNSQMNLDFLSNGFKLRDSNNKVNASGDVYIYCAWAEAPSFNLYGAQSNAR
jgi:hypothetical protein